MGPAGLTDPKQFKSLPVSETAELSNVSPCLSHSLVSGGVSGEQDHEPVDHSVYSGRQRLGRYVRIALKQYEAFDSVDRPLGKFSSRVKAWSAISIAAESSPR